MDVMLPLLILSLVGAVFGAQPDCGVALPHGHSLTTFVDGGFNRLDMNPTDGKVTTMEFDMIIDFDDKNNDSCVSFTEYQTQETKEAFFEINQKMYEHFDPDKDDCLDVDEMNAEFHKIDSDGDGLLVKHEFEHYYTNLLKHLFGPGSCHHTG